MLPSAFQKREQVENLTGLHYVEHASRHERNFRWPDGKHVALLHFADGGRIEKILQHLHGALAVVANAPVQLRAIALREHDAAVLIADFLARIADGLQQIARAETPNDRGEIRIERAAFAAECVAGRATDRGKPPPALLDAARSFSPLRRAR